MKLLLLLLGVLIGALVHRYFICGNEDKLGLSKLGFKTCKYKK